MKITRLLTFPKTLYFTGTEITGDLSERAAALWTISGNPEIGSRIRAAKGNAYYDLPHELESYEILKRDDDAGDEVVDYLLEKRHPNFTSEWVYLPASF